VECLETKVFGLAERELERMQGSIQDSTVIFLLNINSGALIGSFAPVGMPGLNLNPEVFGGSFPAQLKVMPSAALKAVKIDQRLIAGPKTPEETEEITKLLLEGVAIDPLDVDDSDKNYGVAFPRGKAAKAKGKGKGKGKFKGWFPMFGFGKGKGGGDMNQMSALWMLAYGNGKGWFKGKGKGQESKVDDSGGVLGEFVGTIKSFVDSKWYGFIECPEVGALGYKDVFLHGDQKRGYQIGHKVKFTACLNKEGKVQAKDVKSVLKTA